MKLAPQPNTKPNFFRLVAAKRSIIFVENMMVLKIIHTALVGNAIVPCLTVHPGRDLANILAEWHRPGETFKNAAMVVVRPMLAHGVHLEADRTIWIGAVPKTGPEFAMFNQCCARVVNNPLATIVAYTEDELMRFE